jgi:hypothetical protein
MLDTAAKILTAEPMRGRKADLKVILGPHHVADNTAPDSTTRTNQMNVAADQSNVPAKQNLKPKGGMAGLDAILVHYNTNPNFQTAPDATAAANHASKDYDICQVGAAAVKTSPLARLEANLERVTTTTDPEVSAVYMAVYNRTWVYEMRVRSTFVMIRQVDGFINATHILKVYHLKHF